MNTAMRRCLVAFAGLVAGLACAVGPQVDIKANGGKGQVIVLPKQPATISISVDAGDRIGAHADWWLGAASGSSWFSYDLRGSWLPTLAVTYQGPLFSFPPFELTTVSGLPVGRYTLYFGVDMSMNGVLDGELTHRALVLDVPAWSCPQAPGDSMAALSDVQRAFITSRGKPDLFTLVFVTEAFDARGQQVSRASPRRIETWVYNRTNLQSATFDSGHFVGETSHGSRNDRLRPTPLSPSQFSACMGRPEVVALMGEPSCTVTETLAGRTYQHLKYRPVGNRPAATAVLENGMLSSVMAGYALLLTPQSSVELCPTP